MRNLYLIGLFSMAIPASAANFDPPDLQLEMEMHRQYLRSRGLAEVPSATKDSYIENYRIQEGETLWKLSEILYGDGHFWPRVWSQNRSITNPHLIRPGHILQFILGSEDETPSFRFTEPGDQGLELAAGPGGNNNPLIDIPPPEIPPKPVLKLPKSFPQWQTVYKRTPVRVTDDRGLLRPVKSRIGKTYLTAFVQEERLKHIGKFLETDMHTTLPVVNQYVYVQIEKGMGQAGQKMLIVRDGGKIKRQNSNVEIDGEAWIVQIAGEVELSEIVPSEDDSYDVYRALVTKAVSLSTGEYGVIPGQVEQVDLSYMGTPGTTVAQVIGNGRSATSALFSPGDIVFLNKGSASGLAPDQILDIYTDRTLRKKTIVPFSPVPAGTVRVVRVTENLATAVILGARDGILQGDRVQQVSNRHADSEVLEFQEDKYHQNQDESSIEEDLEESDEFGLDF